MKVREPVERPLDVVGVELLLSASQAYVAGVLMYLAVGLWSDRGVGLGSVAVILAVLSLAVGAAWLFWLLGGTGWPLAAANVPVSMFAGFALVLGTQGDSLISLDPLPLLLLIAGSVYGLIGGVFVDSPRRWRWDQRRTLRPGTKVPRVSPTTRALAARVPRSLPKRSTATEPGWPEPPAAAEPDLDDASEPTSMSPLDRLGVVGSETAEETPSGPEGGPVEGAPVDPGVDALPDIGPDPSAAPDTPKGSEPPREPQPPKGSEPPRAPQPPVDAGSHIVDRAPDGSIELPTSVEPKPQSSPWAWAAPPDWNREDEDDTTEGKRTP